MPQRDKDNFPNQVSSQRRYGSLFFQITTIFSSLALKLGQQRMQLCTIVLLSKRFGNSIEAEYDNFVQKNMSDFIILDLTDESQQNDL